MIHDKEEEIRKVTIRISRKISNRIDTNAETLEILRQLEIVICGINESFDRMDEHIDGSMKTIKSINSKIDLLGDIADTLIK